MKRKAAPKIGDPNAYGPTLRDRNGDPWRVVLGTAMVENEHGERYGRVWAEDRVGPLKGDSES